VCNPRNGFCESPGAVCIGMESDPPSCLNRPGATLQTTSPGRPARETRPRPWESRRPPGVSRRRPDPSLKRPAAAWHRMSSRRSPLSRPVNRQWQLARRPEGLVSAEDFRPRRGRRPRARRRRGPGAKPLPLGRPDAARLDGRGHLSPRREDRRGHALLRGGRGGGIAPPGIRARATRAGPLRLAGLGHRPPGLPLLSDSRSRGRPRRDGHERPRPHRHHGVLRAARRGPSEGRGDGGRIGRSRATGSAAAQIAKITGCRVIGIAGGPEKCAYLTRDLGLDGAVDYRAGNVGSALRALCPKGIDVFFDNVGGPVLDVVLSQLALRGRIVLCGGSPTTTTRSRRAARRTISHSS